MAKEIEVTLYVEVPDHALDKDITDWVDVQLCGYNCMEKDNPCIDNAEVVHNKWKHND
ncbi:hypothetical protein [Alteromonas alba]|uniref:hypothetical protein n=1 Tax=Alteromonas alba TaxID=2079529 RepID=UPI0014791BA5|nr:hypothetical protein [Alteromonas alba]